MRLLHRRREIPANKWANRAPAGRARARQPRWHIRMPHQAVSTSGALRGPAPAEGCQYPIAPDLLYQERGEVDRDDGPVVAEHPQASQPTRVDQDHGGVVQSAEFDAAGRAQSLRVPPVPDELDERCNVTNAKRATAASSIDRLVSTRSDTGIAEAGQM
jgi:hypothetical protein